MYEFIVLIFLEIHSYLAEQEVFGDIMVKNMPLIALKLYMTLCVNTCEVCCY